MKRSKEKRGKYGKGWAESDRNALLDAIIAGDEQYTIQPGVRRGDAYWAWVSARVGRTLSSARSKWVRMAYGHQAVSHAIAARIRSIPNDEERPYKILTKGPAPRDSREPKAAHAPAPASVPTPVHVPTPVAAPDHLADAIVRMQNRIDSLEKRVGSLEGTSVHS